MSKMFRSAKNKSAAQEVRQMAAPAEVWKGYTIEKR
jgi:hypothetical protein